MPQVLLFLATVPYFFEFLNVYFLKEKIKCIHVSDIAKTQPAATKRAQAEDKARPGPKGSGRPVP